jgi:hypothetical protein
MKKYVEDRLSKRLRRAAMGFVTCGLVAAGAAQADASDKIVVVPPAELPALARQAGEAMFLHDTIDGRTLLYIEQNQGARLATFDVTDPARIIGKGTVQLDASEPFDFVAPLGDYAELVRYRQNHSDAVLDLPRTKDPQLKPVQGLTSGDSITTLGGDGFTVGSEAKTGLQDYQVVDAVYSNAINHVSDVKQVREVVTKTDTGTTFMLTENGLIVIRRPAVEWNHQIMMITPN